MSRMSNEHLSEGVGWFTLRLRLLRLGGRRTKWFVSGPARRGLYVSNISVILRLEPRFRFTENASLSSPRPSKPSLRSIQTVLSSFTNRPFVLYKPTLRLLQTVTLSFTNRPFVLYKPSLCHIQIVLRPI